MKHYPNIHGSQPEQPPEIDTQSSPTTVYIRENIQKEIIDGVSLWVYDETQYITREYIQLQANELKRTNLAAADLYQSLSATMMADLPESAGYLASIYPHMAARYQIQAVAADYPQGHCLSGAAGYHLAGNLPALRHRPACNLCAVCCARHGRRQALGLRDARPHRRPSAQGRRCVGSQKGHDSLRLGANGGQ